MKRLAEMNKSLLSMALLTTIVVGYNNCGEVSLLQPLGPQAPLPGAGSSQLTYTQLPQSSPLEMHPRLVFVLDMTGSMIQGICPGDVDSNDPVELKANPPACENTNGLDLTADRLKLVKRIIEQNASRPNLKVLLAPFNGPMWSFASGSASFFFSFKTATEALVEVENLLNMHNDNVTSLTGDYPNKMTTSNPAPAVIDVYSKITNDMNQLLSSGVLSQVIYETFLISDGKISPRAQDFISGVEAINSTLQADRRCDCMDDPQEFIDFQLGLVDTPCGPFLFPESAPGAAGRRFCSAAWTNIPYAYGNFPPPLSETFWGRNYGNWGGVFETTWGNPMNNRVSVINAYLSALKGLPKLVGGGELKLNIFAIRPSVMASTNPADLDAERNWIQAARNRFILEPYRELYDDSLNDFYFETYPSRESFTLKHAWLFNLNARVDRTGRLRIDSDGDGLFDDEETGAYNPTTSRSNGICLDSITKNFGCQMVNCKKDVDTDGDSLNECEEISVSTSDYDFDTDQDGIPDSLDVIYQLGTQRTDTLRDDNFDGISNYHNLKMGLHALNDPDDIDESFKIKFNVSESANFMFALQINSIPLVNTRAVSQTFNIYPSRVSSGTSPIPEEHLFLGGSQAAGEQSIVVLLGLEGRTTRSMKWFMKRIKVNQNNPNIAFDAEDLEFFFVKDPL